MNLLYSYAFGSPAGATILKAWRFPVLIDSGAFTAHTKGRAIDLKAYIRFCLDHQQMAAGFIQLDAIGDKEQTARNLDTMLRCGVRPVPVLTSDESPSAVRSMLDINPWVCVAGGPFMDAPTFLRRARAIHKEATAVCAEPILHGLGFTRAPRATAKVGLKTVDSSSWRLQGMAWGGVMIFDPVADRVRPMRKSEIAEYLPPVSVYGKRSKGGYYNWKFIVTVVAYMRMSERLRRSGVEMFFAMNGASQAKELVAIALSVADGWRIDWDVLVDVVPKIRDMDLTDVGLIAEQAVLNLQGQPTA